MQVLWQALSKINAYNFDEYSTLLNPSSSDLNNCESYKTELHVSTRKLSLFKHLGDKYFLLLFLV